MCGIERAYNFFVSWPFLSGETSVAIGVRARSGVGSMASANGRDVGVSQSFDERLVLLLFSHNLEATPHSMCNEYVVHL